MDKKVVDRWVAIALETTGLDAVAGCRVLEVGMVLTRTGQGSRECTLRINPGPCIWDLAASRINGIWPEDVLSAVQPCVAWRIVLEQLAGCQALVAHNVPFVATFVEAECQRLGLEPPAQWRCTMLDVDDGQRWARLPDLYKRHTRKELPTPRSAISHARAVAEVAPQLWSDIP